MVVVVVVMLLSTVVLSNRTYLKYLTKIKLDQCDRFFGRKIERLTSIRQHFEPTFCHWVNFLWRKWPKLNGPSGHTELDNKFLTNHNTSRIELVEFWNSINHKFG